MNNIEHTLDTSLKGPAPETTEPPLLEAETNPGLTQTAVEQQLAVVSDDPEGVFDESGSDTGQEPLGEARVAFPADLPKLALGGSDNGEPPTELPPSGGPEESEDPEALAARYRIKGELERIHPEIEPLPPTPVTPEAEAQLREWGLEDHHIARLRGLTSSFRYDLCAEKLEQIVEKGAYVGELPEQGEVVVLPGGYTYESFSGECGGLAIQFCHEIQGTGCLEEINEKLREAGKPSLQVQLNIGQSRTHFNRENTKHIWSSLLPEGEDHNKAITVDPSFQEISPVAENGYITTHTFSTEDSVGVNPNSAIKVTDYWEDEGRRNIDSPSSHVLGLSLDGNLIYTAAFFKERTSGEIRPSIIARFPGQQSDELGPCIFIDNENKGRLYREEDLSETQRQEIISLLRSVRHLSLTRDQEKIEELRRDMSKKAPLWKPKDT